MLYHCLYKPPEGEAILPTCEREENGRRAKFLYAATHLSKALAFSFSYHGPNPEIIMNGGIGDSPDEFAIVCGGQAVLNRPRHIRVYGFPDEGFEHIEGGRQAVSENPVYFNDAELVFETQYISDLMKNGLQIFLMKESVEQLVQENFCDQYDGVSTVDMLTHMVKTGRARWINHEQNTGVNPTIKEKLSISAVTQAPPSPAFV